MSPRIKTWINFGLGLIGLVLITVFAAALLNLTGDCAPETADCGGTQRKISFLVLAFGAIAIVCCVYRFVGAQRKR